MAPAIGYSVSREDSALMSLAAPYSPAEEAANALTHGAGLLLGVSALTHILHVLPLQLTARQTAGVLTYSISLVLMFLASTLYHAVSQIRVKQILKRCDHCAIYLLIAGTATPLLTIAVQNSAASILLIVIWSMAAVGVGFKLFFAGRFRVLSTATYVLMGALLLVVSYPLYLALSPSGFALLLAGGVAYTVGAGFYLVQKIPFNHAIWHCFVLVGAFSHCWLIVRFVL